MAEESLVDPTMVEMLKDLAMPGQPDPVEEILGIFEEDAAKVVARLQDAEATDDIEGVLRAAHRLKGAAGNVGAVALCSTLSRIEQHAKAGSLAEARPLVARTPGLLAETLRALHALS